MKTKSISSPRSRHMLLVAGLAVCAFASAAEFGASVWRGARLPQHGAVQA